MNEPAAIIGREAEVEAIATLLDSGVTGATALVLDGEPGIGKTTVWDRGVHEARQRGYRVLSCRPSEAEASLPFVSLVDLLEPVADEEAAALAPPQRRALEVALLQARPNEPSDQLAVSRAVLTILRDLAVREPVLVAVDDVQWLDAPSAHALSFALRRAGDLPLHVLVSRRSSQEATQLDLTALTTRELTIGPLAVEDIDRLIASRVGTQLTRPRVLELHRTSGGNPYFALEIVRALELRDSPLDAATPLPIPESVGVLLRERVGALSASAADVVVLAAAAAQPTAALLENLTGSPDGLAEAVAAGILELTGDRLRFTHPLLASVAYTTAAPDQRRAAHQRLAAAAGPGERAHHLALATNEPEEAVAAELEEAAGQSYARGAPGAAAELIEHARRLTPADRTEHLLRRTRQSAEYHLAAGDTERGRALLEQVAAEQAPGPARVDILLRLGQIRYASDDAAAADQLHRQALEEAGDDLRVRAAAEQALAFTTMVAGDMPGALVHASVALELATELDDPGLLALALCRVALTEFMVGKGLDRTRMEQAVLLEEHVGDVPVEWLPSYSYAGVAVYADEVERPRELYAALHRSAADREDQRALPALLFAMSQLELLAGDWTLAHRYATEAVERSRQSGQAGLLANSLCAQALVDAHIGHTDEARTAAEEALQIAYATGALPPLAWGTAVLGFIELSVGSPAAAHARFAPLSERIVSSGLAEPGVVRFLPDDIEALIALGEFEAARAPLRLLGERGRALDRVSALAAAARCRALLHAAQGDADAARASLAEALAEHARLADPFELGRTLLAQGAIERRARRRAEARTALTRALELFDTLGAALWAEKAAAELARIPGRTPSSGELTETERRVAELVAEGLSNKEVAAKLFITVRTVEANLSKVYAKLGVRSRTGLASRFVRRDVS